LCAFDRRMLPAAGWRTCREDEAPAGTEHGHLGAALGYL